MTEEKKLQSVGGNGPVELTKDEQEAIIAKRAEAKRMQEAGEKIQKVCDEYGVVIRARAEEPQILLVPAPQPNGNKPYTKPTLERMNNGD